MPVGAFVAEAEAALITLWVRMLGYAMLRYLLVGEYVGRGIWRQTERQRANTQEIGSRSRSRSRRSARRCNVIDAEYECHCHSICIYLSVHRIWLQVVISGAEKRNVT